MTRTLSEKDIMEMSKEVSNKEDKRKGAARLDR